MPLTLHGIGTAVPTQRLSQAEAVQVAHRINAESPEQERLMSRIYQKTKVLSRGSVLLDKDAGHGAHQERLSFYGSESPGTARRMQAFEDHAGRLALEAAAKALKDGGIPSGAITHLVTVSCTGFQAPGVDLFLIDKLALAPTELTELIENNSYAGFVADDNLDVRLALKPNAEGTSSSFKRRLGPTGTKSTGAETKLQLSCPVPRVRGHWLLFYLQSCPHLQS